MENMQEKQTVPILSWGEEILAAISAPAARRNTQFGSFCLLFLYISSHMYVGSQALSIFGKEAHGLSHTQSGLKSQTLRKLWIIKWLFITYTTGT